MRALGADLELIAERYALGTQHRGIVVGRHHWVSDVEYLQQVDALLARHTPSADAQRALDTGLGRLEQAFNAGMTVAMWEHPGYDDITSSWKVLLRFREESLLLPPLALVDPYADLQEERRQQNRAQEAERAEATWFRARIFIPLFALLIFALWPKCGN